MTAAEQNTVKWSDPFLDQMRLTGDPLADNAVGALFESGGMFSVWELMKQLVQNDHPAPDQLPSELKTYLQATAQVSAPGPALVECGQRLFERCGPEILTVLACYSLPASYAARRGVQVLYRTGYLANRPNHRVFETAQMVMDVLTPGGLDPTGRGIRTAQKVRLMHAAIRRLILTDPERPWDEELGIPINQEDLAGTLMVFTVVIINGLHRLGIATSAEEQQGYLEAWKLIGRILGIQEALIPDTMPEGNELCELIQRRQLQACPEGKAMNDALLKLLEQKLPPGRLRNWPGALMRYFLPVEIADRFEIPRFEMEQHMLESAAQFREELEHVSGEIDRRLWVLRKCALLLLRGMVSAELGGKRTPFILPTNLHHGWAQSHRMSLWPKLR